MKKITLKEIAKKCSVSTATVSFVINNKNRNYGPEELRTLEFGMKYFSDKIYTISDFEFNINSPKQLGEVLFDKLQLKMFKKRSTSVEVLRKLVNHHPIAELILK